MIGRDWLAALSPFPLVLVCRFVEQVTGSNLGVWTWVPAMLVFWISIAALVRCAGGRDVPARWYRRPRSRAIWCWLSLGVGLLSLPGFLGHWRILLRAEVMVPWVIFALVNPLFEEAYWRGLLLDATRCWPRAASISYSAILFAASHSLIWGVQSAALRDWRVLPVLAVIGAVWATAYHRTGSLWCSAIGHACSNLFGMSVPVLMNLYSPLAR